MVVRMRHTRSHTGNRRSHHGLSAPRLSTCPKCSTLHIRHHACTTCGTYRGRQVVNKEAVRAREERRKTAKAKRSA